MWVIAGLGNPGGRYKNTRHNVGFQAIDILAKRLKTTFSSKANYLIAESSIEEIPLILIKPLTYMNLSGLAVSDILKRKNLTTENLIVIHDDLDIPPGRIKIKKGGSSGGHKGIKSIIDSTGSKEFIRVKIGVGRPVNTPTERYVLEKIPPHEKPLIEHSINRAVDAVAMIITEGLQDAMTVFNRREK